MYQKFIIQGDDVRMGRVYLHKELARKPNTPDDEVHVWGGGWWHSVPKEKKLYLYGKSIDFGPAIIEHLQDSYFRPSMKGWEFFFSEEESLADALVNNVKFEPKW